MEKLLVILVFVGAFSFIYAGYQDGPYYRLIEGARTGTNDDDESLVDCEGSRPYSYYHIVNCSCKTYKKCDGSWIRSVEGKPKCVVYNGAGKNGVRPQAHCIRDVINVASETTTDPKVACPENYRIIGCQLHSYVQDEHPTCKSLKSGGYCTVSGCAKGSCTKCRAQARCIRSKNIGSTDRLIDW